MAPELALITTVHDPDQRMLAHIGAAIDRLRWYDEVFAAATDQTDDTVIAALRDAGAHVEIVPAGVPGIAQRLALRGGLEAGHASLLYCDFDRWLHWGWTHPDELAALPERFAVEHSDAWYLCIGRTERAFATHPLAQRLPEEATNRALARLLGRTIDATAGAAWLSREAGEMILRCSRAASKATDLEWPAIVMQSGTHRVQGVFVEGLEFETADFYRDEQDRIGSREAWMTETFDHPAMYQQRLQLAVDSIAAMRAILDQP